MDRILHFCPRLQSLGHLPWVHSLLHYFRITVPLLWWWKWVYLHCLQSSVFKRFTDIFWVRCSWYRIEKVHLCIASELDPTVFIQDPAYYVLKEDASPCIFGPIEKQRWSYACAKQLIERLIYGELHSDWPRSNLAVVLFHFMTFSLVIAAEGAENGLEFTIVRPFNWIGPRMDFIPGIDGPSEGVPRVLACFSNVNFSSKTLVTGNLHSVHLDCFHD